MTPQADWVKLDHRLRIEDLERWVSDTMKSGQVRMRMRYPSGTARNGWSKPVVVSWIIGYWKRKMPTSPVFVRVGRMRGKSFKGETPIVPSPAVRVPSQAVGSSDGIVLPGGALVRVDRLAEQIDALLFQLDGRSEDEDANGFLRSKFTRAQAVAAIMEANPQADRDRVTNSVAVRPRLLERTKGSGFDDDHRAPRWAAGAVRAHGSQADMRARIDELLAGSDLTDVQIAEAVAEEFDRHPTRTLAVVRGRPTFATRPRPFTPGSEGPGRPQDGVRVALGAKMLLRLRNIEHLRTQGISVADLVQQIPADVWEAYRAGVIVLPTNENDTPGQAPRSPTGETGQSP